MGGLWIVLVGPKSASHGRIEMPACLPRSPVFSMIRFYGVDFGSSIFVSWRRDACQHFCSREGLRITGSARRKGHLQSPRILATPCRIRNHRSECRMFRASAMHAEPSPTLTSHSLPADQKH